MDYRPIFFIVGILLVMLGIAMLIPAIVDAAVHNPDWSVFLASAFLTLFVGGTFILMNRSRFGFLGVRQAFVLTTMSWIVIAAFGALPFTFSNLELTYTDAFFEAMSGITTTGSTVVTGLDSAPPGILLWRSLLQWLGGIGIVVMAIAVLPMLRVGGMQLFQMESSDRSDKMMPRAAQVSTTIAAIYLLLTARVFRCILGGGNVTLRRGCSFDDDHRDRRLFHLGCIAWSFPILSGSLDRGVFHDSGESAVPTLFQDRARTGNRSLARHPGALVLRHYDPRLRRHGLLALA